MRYRSWVAILMLFTCLTNLAAGDAVGFLQPQQEVNESAGWVDFIVTRSGTGSGAASVDVQAVGGTAVLWTDYGAPVPATLTWTANAVRFTPAPSCARTATWILGEMIVLAVVCRHVVGLR
jgi:hypothetical protein